MRTIKIINFILTQHDISEYKNIEKKCKESEDKYCCLFKYAHIALAKEDWSEPKKYIDKLTKSGVKDLSQYFDDHEEEIKKLISRIRINRINNALLDLFEAEDIKEYLRARGNSITKEIFQILKIYNKQAF